jgi:glycosyltransferase involved in cell wall biosynthesis
MKILHIITSLRTGGAEHLLVDLLPRLRKLDFEVEVLLFDGTRTPFYVQLSDAGIPIHTLGQGRWAMHNPFIALRLWRFLRKHKFDIIHTHNTPCQLLTALVANHRKCRLITTEHNTSNRRRAWQWARPLDRWMYERYDKTIAISHQVRAALIEHLQWSDDTKRIVTIYNGIPLETFNGAPTKETKTDKHIYLLMVAAFRYQKDQPTVIRAMALLPDEFEIYFIGDGEKQHDCEELAQQLHIAHRVHFLGIRTDVSLWLRKSDIVIQSSHIDGFCLAAVEAMAAGRPVIVSDVPGLHEVVEGAGVLFPHGNAQALAQCIMELAGNDALRKEVAERCQKRAQRFSIERMVDGYAAVYRQEVRPHIVLATTVPNTMSDFWNGWLRRLKEDYDVTAISAPTPGLELIAQREGVATVGIAMARRIAPMKDLMALWQLIRCFRQLRPQMVHSMTPKAGLLCMMAAWCVRVPVRIHTFTGLVFPARHGLTRWVLQTTDRITCACATQVIPEGEGVKHDLLRYHITRKTMHVLGHGNVRGVDLQHYQRTPEVVAEAQALRQLYDIPDDAYVFLFVGRIVRDKGVCALIEAFNRLYQSHRTVYLMVVGRLEEELDPLDTATHQMMNSNPHVIVPGEQDDVRPWYAAAQALVHPSYREGFPNVVIEAGAMGLPCLVTDINGSREIILEGRNGTIVPPKDAEALLRVMEQWVLNTAIPQRLARKARGLVSNRYQQCYIRKCALRYYRSVLKA